jgi:hypothetical protein
MLGPSGHLAQHIGSVVEAVLCKPCPRRCCSDERFERLCHVLPDAGLMRTLLIAIGRDLLDARLTGGRLCLLNKNVGDRLLLLKLQQACLRLGDLLEELPYTR